MKLITWFVGRPRACTTPPETVHDIALEEFGCGAANASDGPLTRVEISRARANGRPSVRGNFAIMGMSLSCSIPTGQKARWQGLSGERRNIRVGGSPLKSVFAFFF